jgi:RNA-binding protein
MSLSNAQIRILRSEAHRLMLKPVVMIGQNGLSENVVIELQQALEHHELIKVRVPATDKQEKSAMIEAICQQLQADLIQSIGHVVVIYKSNPKIGRFKRLLAGKKQPAKD